MRVFLGLGTNLGERLKNLKKALTKLRERGVIVQSVSSVYETQPIGACSPQPLFLNAVVEVFWSGDLIQLLEVTEAVEKEMGRTEKGSGGPRTIDIDILWAQGVRYQSLRLIVPHPRLWQRAFVLVPLSELVSHIDGREVRAVADALVADQGVKVYAKDWWSGGDSGGSSSASV
ncbi:MAG: 2-amino-4-hydroxy-6-hydroxymethyldihydropteridine diphosphokinase [Armatimonadetes bacterium]|nr:2-amino-4-hydroxy-6-hydroxymethyldihydropteridine diphosphokinase [Armatimonadota bacterium]MDW8122261.1 2-amino-4-hydroxy-6-hydroxymethyldihydropteridine diphosphokinase [Armatimonadota bacterium]